MISACVGSFAGRDKRPIVEFALESAQAVRKMATKQAWQKTQIQGVADHLHQGLALLYAAWPCYMLHGPACTHYHCHTTYQATLYRRLALKEASKLCSFSAMHLRITIRPFTTVVSVA